MMEIEAITATSHCVFQTPRKIGNSAMKPENPGMPIETRRPMMKPTAGHGMTFANPPSSGMFRVWARSYTMPTTAKNRAVITPCENICTPEPVRPSRESVEKPSITSPMCETEENPTIYLKSVCTKAIKEPYTTATAAQIMISHDQCFAPSGSSMMPTRSAANAPSFISTPAWNMETAVGAATWPSGDQLWKGQMPPSTAKPRKTGRNQICWNVCEKPALSIASISNV